MSTSCPEGVMAFNFLPYEPEQKFLMPPNPRDWLPDDHLAWFIMDAVEQMDLRVFYRRHREDGWGRAAYDPKMMVALLLYAYCVGERSSRKIERHCREDIAFRVITANQVPDHATIARFRQLHEEALGGLFRESLRLCAEAGLAKVGVVALDGTRMKANASLAANRTTDGIEREIERIVRGWLEEAEAVDAAEDELYGPDRRGDELPAELVDRNSRLARLKEAKARLDAEREAREKAYEEHLERRKAQEAARGNKLRGRKPKPPDAKKQKRARANVTDPDSRIMKTGVGYLQGYNGQSLVNEEGIVLAAELTQDANDVQQLHPMIRSAKENLTAVGLEPKLGRLVADAGYWSEDNIEHAPEDGPELFIATTKDREQRLELQTASSPQGRIPKGSSAQERMERKLKTKTGREIYPKRGQINEPVFGEMKFARSASQFMRRGLSACTSEWKLLNATHNLLKLWRRTAQGSRRESRGQEKAQAALASAYAAV